jgi:hypothetical protein
MNFFLMVFLNKFKESNPQLHLFFDLSKQQQKFPIFDSEHPQSKEQLLQPLRRDATRKQSAARFFAQELDAATSL